MQPDHAIAQSLETVLSAQHIEIWPANADMLVQRGRGNALSLRPNRKCQSPLRLPDIQGLDEQDAAGKGRLAHASYTFV